RWTAPSPNDIIYPFGFDEWDEVPWTAHRLRFTEAELRRREDFELDAISRVLGQGPKERDDAAHKVVKEQANAPGKARFYDIYELTGEFKIPASEEGAEPVFEK